MSRKNGLTPREQQIVKLVVAGLSTRQIATRLRKKPKTIEAHRSNIYRKLRIGKTALLVRWAIEQGVA